MRRILAVTDGSPGSERALDVAAALAAATHGTLSIVTVEEPLSIGQERQLMRAGDGVGDVLDAVSDQILRSAADRARAAGAADVQCQTAWGDPTMMLIDIAKRLSCDAIVVGRRGRGQLAGLLLGSVSQKLVCLAPCTVIVVP